MSALVGTPRAVPVTLVSRILNALRDAGEDGLTTAEIIEDVYDDDRKASSDATVRTAIARHNREATGERIVGTGEHNRDRRWFLSSCYESKLAAAARASERVRARFAPNCSPRFGR